MSSKLSAEEVLFHLEARASVLRERVELHAQQEVHHREQRASVGAELAKVEMNLEALRTALDSIGDLPPAAPVSEGEEQLPAPGRLMVGRLARRVALSRGFAEPFGATAVAAEVNRRFPDLLQESLGTRAASDVLRRMLAEGELGLVRKGKASHEAWYKRR